MSADRPLGHFERYSLSRSLAGVASIVALTALLDAGSEVDTVYVARAVETLVARYPLLGCTVTDVATTAPRFQSASNVDAFVGETEPAQSVGMALIAALNASKAIDVEQGPLWRVWLSPADEAGRRRLTLAVNHVLCDGSAVRNLFAEILSLLRSAPVTSSDVAPTLAPSLEGTVDVRPSTVALIKAVCSDLFVPRLPAFLRPTPTVVFPNPPVQPPYLQPTALKHLSLSAATVAQLKAAAKAQGVATLHPVLYTAALAALTLAVPPDVRSSVLVGESPISLRDPSAGHPPVTGNYVCSLSTAHGPPNPSALFWASCAAYAARLADPAERARARGGIGMLAYIPDGQVPGTERTKFDEWIEKRVRAERPWGGSFEVSNLGVLPATGWEGGFGGAGDGLDEVYWAQTAMVSGAAFAINPIAVRGGALTITLTYRAGAVDETVANTFWQAYERSIRRLADGMDAGHVTFEALASASR